LLGIDVRGGLSPDPNTTAWESTPVPVSRTVEGIAAGQDKLERAVAVVTGRKEPD